MLPAMGLLPSAVRVINDQLFIPKCLMVLCPCLHGVPSHCLSPIFTWSPTGGDERQEEQCRRAQQWEERSFLPRVPAHVAECLLNAFGSHG